MLEAKEHSGIRPDAMLNEVDEKDPRFAQNKDKKLTDTDLGSFGQVLDAVMHPSRERERSLQEIYCDFLGCEIGSLNKDSKCFSFYKAKLFKYALKKIFAGSSPYSRAGPPIKKGSDVVFGGNDKDYEIVQTDVDKQERVPIEYHTGIVRGAGKIVLRTQMTYNGMTAMVFYRKGDEEFVDGFFKFVDEWAQEHNFYRGKKINPSLQFLKLSDLDWGDVFLDKEVKDQVNQNIITFFEKEKIYKKNGISSKCGLIWEGPPGTGKTLTAKILASKMKDITFIWVTPDDLNGSRDVEMIYEIARELNPSIVFFEDADLFCVDRGYGRNNPILGEIMNQLDGLIPLEGVVTIFTTNDPSVMEKALIDRPGRFDERIVFAPPSKEIIVQMMRKNLAKPKHESDDLEFIAKNAAEFKLTGSHIKRLCDLAIIYAINDGSLGKDEIAILKREYFLMALDKMKDMRIKAGTSKAEYLGPSKRETMAMEPTRCYGESAEPPLPTPTTEQKKKRSLIRDLVS